MKTEQELKKIFGQNVKTRRKSRNWSQEKLAGMADVSKNTICDIENGDKFARAITLVKLAKVLETEVYELLKPDNIKPDKTSDVIAKYSEEVRDAVDKIQSSYLGNMKR